MQNGSRIDHSNSYVAGTYVYQEEDSYINPSNVSKVNQSGYYDEGIHLPDPRKGLKQSNDPN